MVKGMVIKSEVTAKKYVLKLDTAFNINAYVILNDIGNAWIYNAYVYINQQNQKDMPYAISGMLEKEINENSVVIHAFSQLASYLRSLNVIELINISTEIIKNLGSLINSGEAVEKRK